MLLTEEPCVTHKTLEEFERRWWEGAREDLFLMMGEEAGQPSICCKIRTRSFAGGSVEATIADTRMSIGIEHRARLLAFFQGVCEQLRDADVTVIRVSAVHTLERVLWEMLGFKRCDGERLIHYGSPPRVDYLKLLKD